MYSLHYDEMQTHFGRAAMARAFSDRQMQLVVGSLLGDGTLLATTAGYCFRAHHGLAQRSLVDWKFAQLRCFVRTAPRISGGGYYFRTISHPWLAELAARFYSDSRKIVPLALLTSYLTPFALAVWIMDDGAVDGRQLRINTQSFTWRECQSLVDLLHAKFALRFTLNADKKRPRLRCASESMGRLRDLVLPFVLPEMRYKLPA